MKLCVYILECSDGTFYTGHTGNLRRRLEEHEEGRGAAYVKGRLPAKLVFLEEHPTRAAAMKREREIKRLRREEKIELADGFTGVRK